MQHRPTEMPEILLKGFRLSLSPSSDGSAASIRFCMWAEDMYMRARLSGVWLSDTGKATIGLRSAEIHVRQAQYVKGSLRAGAGDTLWMQASACFASVNARVSWLIQCYTKVGSVRWTVRLIPNFCPRDNQPLSCRKRLILVADNGAVVQLHLRYI